MNDPVTGQGSNNAMKASKIYLDSILQRGGTQDFTPEWMQETFEEYWRYAESVVTWTNTLLGSGPPPPHILNLLGAAGQCQLLADAFANGFNDPRQFFPWWLDPEACEQFMAQKMAG